MNLHILAIGNLRAGPERILVDDYIGRFNRIARTAGLRGLEETQLAAGGGNGAEGARLLARCPEGADLIVLDETGRDMSSASISARLVRRRDEGLRHACFLIGGAEGHGRQVQDAASLRLAFGAQTWPHRLVRVMLAEQLYRAATILAGQPYHKE